VIDQAGLIKLWTRSLKATDAAPVPGTEGAASPFWSADGRSLGFFAGGRLKTVELGGGNLQALADSPSVGMAAWAPDGTILFRPGVSSPLFRVSAAGGQAAPMRALGANDYAESDPAMLPDGKHILMVVSDKNQHWRIEMRSLVSSEARVVLYDARQPAYAAGFLFFIRNQKIFAQPFDAGSGKVSGNATPLADADWYSVAGPSMLAFQSFSHDTRLQWFDMSGNPAGHRPGCFLPFAKNLAGRQTDAVSGGRPAASRCSGFVDTSRGGRGQPTDDIRPGPEGLERMVS